MPSGGVKGVSGGTWPRGKVCRPERGSKETEVRYGPRGNRGPAAGLKETGAGAGPEGKKGFH